jgi:hypothetical protein
VHNIDIGGNYVITGWENVSSFLTAIYVKGSYYKFIANAN